MNLYDEWIVNKHTWFYGILSSDNILSQFSQEKMWILATATVYGNFITNHDQEQ